MTDLAGQARRRVEPNHPWRLLPAEVGEKTTGKLLLMLADKVQPVQWIQINPLETPEDLWEECMIFIDTHFDAALNRLRYGTDSPHGGQGEQPRPFGHRLYRL